jgi:hypothetical protein
MLTAQDVSNMVTRLPSLRRVINANRCWNVRHFISIVTALFAYRHSPIRAKLFFESFLAMDLVLLSLTCLLIRLPKVHLGAGSVPQVVLTLPRRLFHSFEIHDRKLCYFSASSCLPPSCLRNGDSPCLAFLVRAYIFE